MNKSLALVLCALGYAAVNASSLPTSNPPSYLAVNAAHDYLVRSITSAYEENVDYLLNTCDFDEAYLRKSITLADAAVAENSDLKRSFWNKVGLYGGGALFAMLARKTFDFIGDVRIGTTKKNSVGIVADALSVYWDPIHQNREYVYGAYGRKIIKNGWFLTKPIRPIRTSYLDVACCIIGLYCLYWIPYYAWKAPYDQQAQSVRIAKRLRQALEELQQEKQAALDKTNRSVLASEQNGIHGYPQVEVKS